MAEFVHIKVLFEQRQPKIAMKAQTKHKSQTYLIASVRSWLCATPMSPRTHWQHSSVCSKKHVPHSPAAQSNKHELQAMYLEHGTCK